MSTPSSFNDALRLLRDKYRKELPVRLAEFETQLDALRLAEKYDADNMEKLYRIVHSLTGSGATFGLTTLSNAARALEITLKACVQDAAPFAGKINSQINAQWSAVKQAALLPDTEPPLLAGVPENSSAAAEYTKKDHDYILLVEDDIEQAQNIGLQLGHFGYNVKILHDHALLNATVEERMPMVIIMDIVFPDGHTAGPQAITGLPDKYKDSIPVIFISSRSDINARLSAIRAGASAYFTKPIEMGALVDKLDGLASKAAQEMFKIMIVEDSPALAAYYSMILQTAGMDTVVVTDPLKILEAISEFTPELILMDMYMPGCSGLELAKVIRQQEAYVSTPIVFLSAETDIEKQLEAMQFGADDFLTKPIQPSHLISSVTSRVQRYRILRSFMVRDSLTGLLNHVKIKEELALEIVRAQRQKNSLVFAMVDIDFFKKVNDNYGHPTGDRVIKSLSRLLQQRLRKSDVIGRYGGEEFAVILKDTDAASAFATLDNIRKAFGKIAHHSEKGDFSVTLSCGLAEFPDYTTAADLNNAADKALYEAKGGGRNRVVTANL